MKHLVLASFASALIGGMSGTGLVIWLTRNDARPEPTAPGSPTASPAELARRLDAVERALAEAQPRVRVLPTALASTEDEPRGAERAAVDEVPVRVDSPVFEAAVLDILERSGEGRDSQRPSARTERLRKQHDDWANELTLRLGLTPAQTDKLRAVQSELDSQLERQQHAVTPGAPVSRGERRAARRAILEHADQLLRGALAPRQQAAYDQLDDGLKLYRPARDD